ncbi:AP-4 complex accessory subunit Tepsin isoform X2 [Periophthalmus magnuspinnatus]|uniref:AP-4 complex accessory subunit Tepsin isoform X2 n=1 Tax=Periophthalmus magnuspinnatus TaxID=409849 RepID=UPI00145BF61F|nr:AP-4 complex accessory subunit Tepsin isoform X2 [Periophthalmus magnuspinnatus]
MATFMERLAFLQKVPTLMKATADDENPCPGYLFQEISKISHESLGNSQCLLEYLLERLQVKSCHVKLKVLKIFVHLCDHGSNHFLTELRRNSTFIQQASVYSGPPDPIHGTALYQRVRNTAQEVARLLFTDTIAIKNSISANPTAHQPMGMGSAAHKSGMQGFGYSPIKQGSGNDSLLDKIQKAAEVVASAVLPPTEQQGIRLYDNHYRAVVAPAAPIEVAVPACSYNLPARKSKVTQRYPGQIGGGWEETDSANSSSRNSSQEVSGHCKASTGRGSAGTGSQSGASRESNGDLSERVEALQLGDCAQEVALINTITEGSKVFLSREESQHFIKESSTLNCEVVVDLLAKKLQDPSDTVKMRTMCALACFMTSDLLSLEQIFAATQSRLYLLSEGASGPVANKATKLLRQFEALTRGLQPLHKQPNSRSNHHTSTDFTSACTDPLDLKHPAQVPQVLPEYVPHPLHEGPDECGETAEAEVRARDEIVQTNRSPLLWELHRSDSNRLSLFSGMELVTTTRPMSENVSFQTEEKAIGDILNVSQEENTDGDNLRDTHLASVTAEDTHFHCTSVSSDNTQVVSAFSFLNS